MTRDEVLEEIAKRGEQESAEWKAMKEPGYAMAVTAFVRVIRSLKSKPPEKSPGLEAPKDTGTAFGEIYEALDTVKAALAAGRVAEDRLLERRREVDFLKHSLEWFQDRERYFAGVLELPDGGQRREDWGERIQGLMAERDSLRTQLATSEQERRTDRMLLDKRENVSAQLESLRRELPQYDCRRTGGPASDSGGKHCPQEAPCLTCQLERAERDRDFATAASERILRDLETTKAEVARLKWEASDAPMLGEHSGHPSTCPACRDGYTPPPGDPAPR